MKFKVWCTEHDIPLVPFDDPPICIPAGLGIWEVDLSFMQCAEADEVMSCTPKWTIEVVPA
jgi:hypothetical protein